MVHRKALIAHLFPLLTLQGAPFEGAWAVGQPCAEASTTAQMIECAGSRFEEADRDLNRVYRVLLTSLDGRRRERLLAAQRAWLTFRDAQVQFAGSAAEEGSLRGVLELSEKAALTEQRTEQLEKSPR